MDFDKSLEWVEKYEELTFLVHKRGEVLATKEIAGNLTYDQHFTLGFIMKRGRCTSTDLADHFHVQKSAVTAIINRLAAKGLVRRERDRSDRRIVHLIPTKKGVEFYNACNRKIHDVLTRVISHFKEEEIEAFLNTYEKLAFVLDQAIREIER
jgi:DNA-binding MarR family transcriptional regulator